MSAIIRQPEVLMQEVIQMQREAAAEFAKKGLKKLAHTGSTPSPNRPSNFNDMSKFKKYSEMFRLDSTNKITSPDLNIKKGFDKLV